jgi:SAM-dependent methyltransferase
MGHGDAAFMGSMPQLYDQKLGALLFAPYAADLAARLAVLTGGRLLETAAGTGLVTAALAKRLPPAVEIVATDLNQPMLDYAAGKADLGRVQWRQASAQALPFPDESFDAVVCQFGVMFFPDRIAGYREARRVLKPGHRLVFNVWDRIATNPVMAAVVEGLSRRYPHHKSWFLERTPCGYYDETVIRGELGAAGFTEAHIEIVRRNGQLSTALDAAIGLCQGSPQRTEIEGLDIAGLEGATRDAAAAVAERCGNGPSATPLQALVIEAVK